MESGSSFLQVTADATGTILGGRGLVWANYKGLSDNGTSGSGQPSSASTGCFFAHQAPLAHARGSDQSRDRQGAAFREKRTIASGRNTSLNFVSGDAKGWQAVCCPAGILCFNANERTTPQVISVV